MATSGLPWPSDPHLRRWMLFVDGENFAIRGQKWAADHDVTLEDGKYYKKDIFLWLPAVDANTAFNGDNKSMALPLQPKAIRAYYYTSLTGDEPQVNAVKKSLWELGFNPIVFKRPRGLSKSKGVDIALTKDVLSNAHLDNYDTAVLIAGDADYVSLVEEVKRLGKIVHVIFFEGTKYGLSNDLRLASDQMFPIDSAFKDKWKPVEEVAQAAS